LYITARKKAQQSARELLALFHLFIPLLMLLESSAKSDPTNSSLCVYPLLSCPGTIEAPASGDLQKLSEWDPVTLY